MELDRLIDRLVPAGLGVPWIGVDGGVTRERKLYLMVG
jgi:hypothetical protein